jgi:predicted DNA-binding transcriptional regulator AlpA
MKKSAKPEHLVKARAICARLGDKSRRTLYDWIKAGKFPPPDRPAQKRGEADLWLESTAERGIQDYLKTRSATRPSPPPAAAL